MKYTEFQHSSSLMKLVDTSQKDSILKCLANNHQSGIIECQFLAWRIHDISGPKHYKRSILIFLMYQEHNNLTGFNDKHITKVKLISLWWNLQKSTKKAIEMLLIYTICTCIHSYRSRRTHTKSLTFLQYFYFLKFSVLLKFSPILIYHIQNPKLWSAEFLFVCFWIKLTQCNL